MTDKKLPPRRHGPPNACFHGPTHWAAAVRRADGKIGVASGPKPHLSGPIERVPGARGVIRLRRGDARHPLVKRALPEARLPFQTRASRRGRDRVGRRRRARRRSGGLAAEAAWAAASVLPSLVALRGGRGRAYHGVEHKATPIRDRRGDARDAARSTTARLASHGADAGGQRRGHPAPPPRAERPSKTAGAAVSLASSGSRVRGLRVVERHSGTGWPGACAAPATSCSASLGSASRTDEQLDVGRAALAEILRVEARPGDAVQLLSYRPALSILRSWPIPSRS